MTQIPPVPTGQFERILVPIDFSASAKYALELTRQRFAGAQIRLLHVVDSRASAVPDIMGGLTSVRLDVELLEQQEEVQAKQLSEWLQEGEEGEQIIGDPISGIVHMASQWPADLIVMGTHDRSFLEHLLLGSSAEKIVERSPVPVLTVRLPELEESAN